MPTPLRDWVLPGIANAGEQRTEPDQPRLCSSSSLTADFGRSRVRSQQPGDGGSASGRRKHFRTPCSSGCERPVGRSVLNLVPRPAGTVA